MYRSRVARLAIVALLLVVLGPARAAETINLLIVDGQNNHDWKATTPVLKEILEGTGRFSVDVATAPPKGQDLSSFRPDFAAYGAVLLNYNGELWPERTRVAFVEYVEGGGGVVVVHAANNAFPRWEEYNRIIGVGGWGGRTEKDGPYLRYRDGRVVRDPSPGRGGSHGRQHEYTVVHREPCHPITHGLATEWKHARDELYDRLRGPAEGLTVLATAFSAPETGGTGEHEPILMVIDFGRGRVFHTVLGDNPGSMKHSAGFQTTLARGAEWAATGTVTQPAPPGLAGDSGGWSPLFDGETLDGWTRRNGTASYRVEHGTVVGKTSEGSPNSFLCTEKDYADFELRFEVLVDDPLNSGVQIRSRSTEEFNNGRVHGPQVEIAANGTAGFIYGEALGTGWLSEDRSDPAARAAFRSGAWNRYRVKAVGPSIKTWINGVPVADLTDTKTRMRSGFMGLQVHGIRKGSGPYEVRWRNIYVKDLSR